MLLQIEGKIAHGEQAIGLSLVIEDVWCNHAAHQPADHQA
jgi:hypothetical protein